MTRADALPAPVAERRLSPAQAFVRRPHLVLAAAAGITLLCEAASHETGSSAWMMLAAAIVAAGFLVVWRQQDRLRLVPLLLLTAVFQVTWISLHLGLGVTSFDSEELYRGWGNELLDSRYPESQYPPGAVLLFALDAWLGGGETRTAHAFVMVPFQLLTVLAVWLLRRPLTPWLAAIVALWPMNAFFWEFRFDLVPTALLALGLLFAVRGRWSSSGALLGLGAAVKWTPGVAFGLFAVWLLVSGRRRQLAFHVLAFASVFALLHLPFLLWRPDETLYAYRYFSGQGLTGESVWYLLLAPLGLATVDTSAFWLPADVPGWADPLAVSVQAFLLILLVVAALRVRCRLDAAVAIAALGPVVFLLGNRIFSPQYLVLMLVAWAIAGSLVLATRREQLVLGALIAGATTANAFVYPYTLYQLDLWRVASAVLFLVASSASLWLVVRAVGGPAGDDEARRVRVT